MRNYTYMLLLATAAIGLLLSSCSTVEKYNVYAQSGTAIYTPGNSSTAIAVSNGNQPVKMQVPSADYYGYLIAENPVTGLKAPFGLDVRKKVRHGEKAALGIGWALAGAGMGTLVSGTSLVIAAAASGDDDLMTIGAITTGTGAGCGMIGGAILAPASSRLEQLTHSYQFTYCKDQTINFDGLSAKLLNPNMPKGQAEVPASPGRSKAISGKGQISQESGGTDISKTSAARKLHSDLGKKVEGTYIGSGQLLYGKNVEEYYKEVVLLIESIGKNRVKVRVIESDEDFFAAPIEYMVEKDKSGGWILKIEDIPSATILIDKSGKARFEHKSVNIDNEIYSLSLTANRKSK